MPVAAASASEVTNQPMDAEPNGYTDPFWSNAGAGFRDVSGRVTALAVDGARLLRRHCRRRRLALDRRGAHWAPDLDNQPTLSIGALYVAPDHSVVGRHR